MSESLRVVLICTSNHDRSPALEKYLMATHPGNEYRSAGINKFFCESKGTHYITKEDIDWCDLIVYAEDVHREVIRIKFDTTKLDAMEKMKRSVILNCGEYTQGCIGEDWLTKAEEKLKPYLA